MIRAIRCGAFAILLVGGPDVATACQCTGMSFLWGGFAEACQVFEGTVTSVKDTREGFQFFGGIEVQFDVIRSWKGDRKPTMIVETGANSCGYPFEVGEVYVVFAYPRGAGGGAFTEMCTRTKGGTWRFYERVLLGPASWTAE